jgi:hypothetical protein
VARLKLLIAVFAVIAALIPTLPAAASGERFVIDFEGLAEGAIVKGLSAGVGTSGDAFAGTVGVFGWQEGDAGTQRAMIFDGTCAPRLTPVGCSGQDSDLFFPGRSNILIVSEDLDQSDPDDGDASWFGFEFSALGSVTIDSVGILDTNAQTSELRMTLASGTIEVRSVPGTGDGRSVDVPVGVSNVTRLEISLGGLGAVDDIVVTVDAPVPPSTTTTTSPPTTIATTTTTTSPPTTTTTVPGTVTTTTSPTTTTTSTVPATTTTLPISAGLALEVLVDGVAVGTGAGPEVETGTSGVISYVVTNQHHEKAYSLYLKQSGLGRISCPDNALDPGEVVICEVAVTYESGHVAELATAKAWPESTELVGTAQLAYEGVADVTAGFINIAPSGFATQSSTANWGSGTPASLAIDGDLNGDRDGGSVAMTYRVADPWWEIDLGAVYELDSVTLWNRTDCCSERLNQFHVFVSDVAYEVRDIANTSTQAWVLDVYHHAVAGRRTDVPIGRSGRYLRVQLAYQDAVLQLAEVEVWVADTAPVPPAPSPSIEMRVTADPVVVTAGDDIHVDYEVTNTGPARLWALYIRHADVGSANCPIRKLLPGETVSCTLTVSRPAGSWSDEVIAKTWDDAGNLVSTAETVEYLVDDPAAAGPSAIDLQVALSGSAVGVPGPQVTFGSDLDWRYSVTNTGSSDLWALYLKHGTTIISCPDRDLAPGEVVECSRTLAAGAGDHVDDVVVSAWDTAGDKVTNTVAAGYRSNVAVGARSFSLTARVGADDAQTAPGPVVAAGSQLPLEFAATNTGAVTLHGLWVSVPGLGLAICPDRQIEPGETATCSLSDQAVPGQYSTLVRAVVYDGSGEQLEAFDWAHFFVPSSTGAAVHLDVLVDGLNGDQHAGPRIAAGQLMTFSYLVTDGGSVPLSGVTLSDTAHGLINCPADSVAPGAMLVCTHQEVATPQYTHFDSTVSGVGGGQTVTDTERLYYHVRERGREEALALTVTINGVAADTAPGPALEVGRRVQVRYILTNTSSETNIHSASISDPRVPDGQISCSGGPFLNRGQSMVCSTNLTIEPGDWANIVSARGYGQNGVRIDTSDRVHYTGVL